MGSARIGIHFDLLDAPVAFAEDELPDLENEEQRREQGERVHAIGIFCGFWQKTSLRIVHRSLFAVHWPYRSGARTEIANESER